MKRIQNNPDLLEEYDFSQGVRGKYAQRYSEGANVVVIEPDLAKYFPHHDAVNDACDHWLRSLKSQGKSIAKKAPPLTSKFRVWMGLPPDSNSRGMSAMSATP